MSGKSADGIGQCEICDNGSTVASLKIDGAKVGVCSTCESELEALASQYTDAKPETLERTLENLSQQPETAGDDEPSAPKANTLETDPATGNVKVETLSPGVARDTKRR